MTKATSPKPAGGALDIGRAVDDLAHGTISESAAEVALISNIQRPGGPDVDQIAFVKDSSPTNKMVIVPDPGILDDMKPPAQSPYWISEDLINVAAYKLLKDHSDNHPGVDFKDYVEAKADDRPSEVDYFHIRLGEYLVTQCQ